MKGAMRFRVTLLAVLAAAVMVSGRAAAQEADAPRDIDPLRRQCAGRAVRVSTSAGGTVRGQCGPVEDARLVVRDTAGRVWEMPYNTVEGVWVRRTGTRRGAIAGGVVGGVVGGVWGGLVASALCGEGRGDVNCGDDVLLVGLLTGTLGGLGGAGVGAVIGSTTRVWVRIHP